MRKALLLTALAALALTAKAEPRYIAFECRIGTNAAAIVTDSKNPIGYIDEIYVQAPAANVTADVCLVSYPNVGISTNLAGTVLFTNGTLTATATARPRVAQTDSAGSALTNLTTAERFLCAGDPVTFRVSQVSASTGLTFKAWIKVDQK